MSGLTKDSSAPFYGIGYSVLIDRWIERERSLRAKGREGEADRLKINRRELQEALALVADPAEVLARTNGPNEIIDGDDLTDFERRGNSIIRVGAIDDEEEPEREDTQTPVPVRPPPQESLEQIDEFLTNCGWSKIEGGFAPPVDISAELSRTYGVGACWKREWAVRICIRYSEERARQR